MSEQQYLVNPSEWGGGTGIIGVVLDDIIIERKRQRELYPSSVSRFDSAKEAVAFGHKWLRHDQEEGYPVEYGLQISDEVMQEILIDG